MRVRVRVRVRVRARARVRARVRARARAAHQPLENDLQLYHALEDLEQPREAHHPQHGHWAVGPSQSEHDHDEVEQVPAPVRLVKEEQRAVLVVEYLVRVGWG